MKGFIEIFAALWVISANVSLAEDRIGEDPSLKQYAVDPLNATYLIEGKATSLIHGRSELPAAQGSAIKTKTAVLGRPVYGDLNGDGEKDAALLITHDPGGSGTFYYVAAAININRRFQGTNAVLLGDRIASINIELLSGTVVVKYADRRSEEPMSAWPTVNKTMVLFLKDETLVKIGLLGEGE